MAGVALKDLMFAAFLTMFTSMQSASPPSPDDAITLDLGGDLRLRQLFSKQSWGVAGLFAALVTMQALGFGVLGIGRAGQGVSECILVIENALAFACAWLALRRTHGITALFWFLFMVVIVVLMVPTAIQAYDTVFQQVTLSESTRGLIYCLYGAPILMMLFLPEAHGRDRFRSEIFLDLFQVTIVVTLIYSTFFFLPDRHMVASEALLHSVTVSDLQSLLLVLAGFVRLQFSHAPGSRNLLLRLTIFLATCAVATYIGDWVDVHFHLYSPWFDLGWSIPIVVAALIAITWEPSPVPQSAPSPANFLSFLGANLVLVTMLSSTALLMEDWKRAYGETLTHIAIAASLLSLTVRLALTQFHQHREIAQRRAAQEQLAISHQKVAGLLEGSQRQTAEITQINQLGNLFQTCRSRKDVFGLIPERMVQLFPGCSGAIAVLNVPRTGHEIAAEWGPLPPVDLALAWGSIPSQGNSISAPMVADDELIGVFALQHDLPFCEASPGARSSDFHRRQQLASALAEQIALTVANLDLREALHTQAIRDPLTGLFNRRYMRETLEREIHRARRHMHPLSVMMLDIDHFKRYNDTFGHAAGDNALRLVGDCLLNAIRAEDLACRYGGEEFIVILPQCSLSQAVTRAEQIRTSLRGLYAERPGELPEVITASIGVAAFKETTEELDLLLKLVDEALYEAKHEGRDRVVAARSESSRGLSFQPKDDALANTRGSFPAIDT